jgi:hypothetical protein
MATLCTIFGACEMSFLPAASPTRSPRRRMRGTKTLARPKAARKNAPPFCVFTLRAAVLFELRLPFPLPHLRGAFFFFCLVFLCLGIVVAKHCLAFKLREGALLKYTDQRYHGRGRGRRESAGERPSKPDKAFLLDAWSSDCGSPLWNI